MARGLLCLPPVPKLAGGREARSREKTVERAKGIEPSSRAWEARVMPLYDARLAAEPIATNPPPACQQPVRLLLTVSKRPDP